MFPGFGYYKSFCNKHQYLQQIKNKFGPDIDYIFHLFSFFNWSVCSVMSNVRLLRFLINFSRSIPECLYQLALPTAELEYSI